MNCSGIVLHLHTTTIGRIINGGGNSTWKRWQKVLLFTCSMHDSCSGNSSPRLVAYKLLVLACYCSASSTGTSRWSRGGQGDWDWEACEEEEPGQGQARRSVWAMTRKGKQRFDQDFRHALADWRPQDKKLLEREETAQGVWSLGLRNVAGEGGSSRLEEEGEQLHEEIREEIRS